MVLKEWLNQRLEYSKKLLEDIDSNTMDSDVSNILNAVPEDAEAGVKDFLNNMIISDKLFIEILDELEKYEQLYWSDNML